MADFNLPLLYYPLPSGWFHWSFAKTFCARKLESFCAIVCLCLSNDRFSRFDGTPTCDRRKDGQTNGRKSTAHTVPA